MICYQILAHENSSLSSDYSSIVYQNRTVSGRSLVFNLHDHENLNFSTYDDIDDCTGIIFIDADDTKSMSGIVDHFGIK